MRTRALISVLAGLLLAGIGSACGSSAPPPETAPPDALTVYSSLPLRGPDAERSRDVLDGEQLAIEEPAGAVRAYPVELRSLDDTGPAGEFKPDTTLEAAEQAAEDPSTIAFLGGIDAAATALSLPPMNTVGVLQVSPGTTYEGFSGGPGSGAGEPEKYRPSERATFGRIAPRDTTQAAAIAGLMADHGCRRVAVLRAPSGFDQSLADLIGAAAEERGMRVVLEEQVRPDPEEHERAAEDVAEQRADCATFAGTMSDAPADLLKTLHATVPGLWMVAPMALSDNGLARRLGDAAASVVIVGPPQPSAAFTAAFERRFGRSPGPWAPYGRDAMRRVLLAIERAGDKGNDRAAVVDAYLALPDPPERIGLWRPTAQGLRHVQDLPLT